jgi:hypothetical protein
MTLKSPTTRGLVAAALALLLSGTAAPTASAANGALDLSNAPVPAGMCDHPAGHLVNGTRDLGQAGHETLGETVFGRIRGGAVAAALIVCDAGGTAIWPSTLVMYRRGSSGQPVLMASYDLFKLSKDLIDRQGPTKMTLSKHKVHIATGFSNGCGASLNVRAAFRVRGKEVVVSGLQRSDYTPPMYC